MKIDKITGDTTYQIELTLSERANILGSLAVASMNGDVLESIRGITSDRCGDGIVETTKKFMALIGDTASNEDCGYYDPKTGLEWRTGDDKDINFDDARKWIYELSNDWRLPARAELKALYREIKPVIDKGMLFPEISILSWHVWSDELRPPYEFYKLPSMWIFNFYTGRSDISIDGKQSHDMRVLAVRSRNNF